ncbi:hypothetical protein [Streptomyces liangshanensis]|uniref:Uncharacterized protein n=1 Tax=Streptomyces liangshanensis TaxID=2717324 RepID=A0A6G9GZ25_9ACTN|nr:hypothetical protein [Streptomyces liangshanensis]QIQ03137.1 hypothetical protein HA039_13090 [Streptomyces liangshanensis]
MISQSVSVTGRCGACGGVLTRNAGQRIDQDEVRWDAETTCGSCPATTRAGSHEPPTPTPEEIRQLLLQEHGPAHLTLTDGTANLISVTRALSRAHGLSLGEARTLSAELRTTGLTGTLVEMEHLATTLRARDVPVTVTPTHPA